MQLRRWAAQSDATESYTRVIHCGAAVICAGYSFYHFIWDLISVGVFTLVACVTAVLSVYGPLKTQYLNQLHAMFFLSLLLALSTASFYYGIRGILVLFPIINALFYIFKTHIAATSAIVFVVASLTAAFNSEPTDILIRTLPALMLCILFSASFTRTMNRHNRELDFVANHDVLTEIHNRRGFLGWLEEYLQTSAKHNRQVTLYFFDLDGFKQINDRYGHDMGDKVLIAFTKRLTSSLRSSELVTANGVIQNLGRLSGDEFVLALPGVDEQQGPGHIGKRLLQAFEPPMMIDNQPIQLKTSIGVSFASDCRYDLDNLISEADSAMYRAKQQGKNRLCVATHLTPKVV